MWERARGRKRRNAMEQKKGSKEKKAYGRGKKHIINKYHYMFCRYLVCREIEKHIKAQHDAISPSLFRSYFYKCVKLMCTRRIICVLFFSSHSVSITSYHCSHLQIYVLYSWCFTFIFILYTHTLTQNCVNCLNN